MPCFPLALIPQVNRSPRFQGALATQACQNHWLTPTQLKDVLSRDTDPYVGQVPAKFLQESGLTENQAQQFLDQISEVISTDYHTRTFRSQLAKLFRIPKTIPVPFSNAKIPLAKLRYVGRGYCGHVYALQLGAQKYAVKWFPNPFNNTPSLLEIASGTFLTHQPVKNLSHVYVANAEKRWMLMEHISRRTPYANRPGKTLAQLGVEIGDNRWSNRIGKFVIDHGAVNCPHRFRQSALPL